MIDPKIHIEHVLDLARQSGVAADVVLNTSAQLSIKAEGGELSQYTAASSHAMGLRLIRDGRVGSSYTESLESTSLRGMFEQAMGNAAIARKDEHHSSGLNRSILPRPKKIFAGPIGHPRRKN